MNNSLTIIDKSSMMGLSLPHKIYIDNYYIGIVKGKSATINGFPLGRYNIMIQSMIPYFSSSSTIEIKEGSNTVEFKDKERKNMGHIVYNRHSIMDCKTFHHLRTHHKPMVRDNH